MSADWDVLPLQSIAAESRNAIVGGPFGSDLVSKDYVDHGVPVIRGQNLSGRWISGPYAYVTEEKANALSGNLARKGDIVFTQRGTLGQISIVPESQYSQFLISQSQMKMTPDPAKADALFLYYIFRTEEYQNLIRTNAIQTGVPHINLGILRSIKVPLPPLSEQRAIAHILGTLDDKIETNRKMNETLEAMARALFKSWFVDFDPVRKKLAGQPTGLPPEIDALFPGEFEDSALGDGSTALTAGIPKGWRVGNIYEICDVIYGAPFQSKLFNTENNGKPLVRIRDLKDEQPGVYTPEIHPKGYLIQPGDLLVGMDGEFRSYLWGSEPAWLNQRVCCFVPKFGISTLFLQHTIDPQLHFIEATEVATTVIHLGKGDIDNFKSLLPPMEVQKQFSQMADAIRAKILVNKSGLRVLSQLRDTLLPKLISGELRVKDTERFVGGVV